MTRDEIKEKAKELGLRVRDSWMDDVAENSIIAAVAALIGFAVGKFF